MNKSVQFADSLESSNEQFDLTLDHSGGPTAKKRKKQKGSGEPPAWYYLGFLGEIGFSISLPIAGGALLGAYLDSLLGSYPKGTVSFLFVGIVVSIASFIRIVGPMTKRT